MSKRSAEPTKSVSSAPRKRASRAVEDALVDQDPRCRGAFLSREGKRRIEHGGHHIVEVGVGVDDHAVLAAHLGDDALDVPLARRELRRATEDLETNGRRAGEGDCVDARMPDERRADLAFAGEQSEHAVREARRSSASWNASAHAGDCSAGLRQTPLPAASAAAVMPVGDREREVPRAR